VKRKKERDASRRFRRKKEERKVRHNGKWWVSFDILACPVLMKSTEHCSLKTHAHLLKLEKNKLQYFQV
jgi:hypothetical protein